VRRAHFTKAAAGLIGTLLLGLSMAAQAGEAGSTDSNAAPTGDQPILVRVFSENGCGPCKATHSVWARLVTDHEDSAKIVVLDVTDEPRGKASVALAKEVGIIPFFQVNVGRPGTIGVLMPDGSPVEIFKGRLDKRDYDAALAKAKQWIDDPASRPPPVAAETEGATRPPAGRGMDPS